jgi:hypothetical protein
MSDRKAQMKGDPTGWLLEADNPSVRYLALRHLLGRPEADPEVQAARAAIPRSRVVERIFARHDTGGFWGDPASPYQPKYKASYWTLMVLGHLGLSREDERVQRAVGHIFRFHSLILWIANGLVTMILVLPKVLTITIGVGASFR